MVPTQILKSMPKPFLHQMEALCSMAISVASESRFFTAATDKSKQAPGSSKSFAKLKTSIPGPLAQNPRLIQVPLAFDSKFQRGPWDPYGRPPRLAGQLPALRQPSQDSQRSRSLLVNKGSVMPEIGADSAVSLTIQEAAKRQREIALELEASGQYVSADMQEMYGSIPHNLWEVPSEEKVLEKGLSSFDQTMAAADPSLEMWAFEPSHSHHHGTKDGGHGHSHSEGSLPHESHHSEDSHHRRDAHHMSTGERRHDGDLLAPLSADSAVSRSQAANATMPSRGGARLANASRQSRNSTRGGSLRGSSTVSTGLTLFDTETKFDRPHKCSFDGCNQAFSRVYTLKLHEKSHLMFPEYHKFRHDPLLAFDADAENMVQEARQKLMTRENLPLLREIELERTLLMSAHSAASSTDW
jgi:hypothetical protein